jgi:ABC-type dipeptide/oligopeptide/nickel transport system ATPase component
MRLGTLGHPAKGPAAPPPGCRYHSRCWKRQPVCAQDEPALEPRPASPHPSACHFAAQRELPT